MKTSSFLILLLLLLRQTGTAQVPGMYLGLTPPGNTPEVFAPGIVSLPGRNERVITFSPSGAEIFFAIGNWPTRTTMYIQYKDSAWTTPETASFSVGHSAEEPFFSPDGSRVYFYAYPPSSASNADLFYSEKTGDTWGPPVNVGTTLNTSGDEFHPNVVADGSLYFANGAGRTCRAQFTGTGFLPRVQLPANVNSWSWPDHYVAPDESYMIFTSAKAGGYGSSDLYISFRNADSTWTTPQNLGSPINTPGYEGSADVTPDGLYMTYDNVSDIYWVKIDNVIDSLKAISGVTTAVISPSGKQDFDLCPNPASGYIRVRFPAAESGPATLEICAMTGETLISAVAENNTSVDLSRLPKGIYLAKLAKGTDIWIRKIVLE